jgi:hypothetical protein
MAKHTPRDPNQTFEDNLSELVSWLGYTHKKSQERYTALLTALSANGSEDLVWTIGRLYHLMTPLYQLCEQRYLAMMRANEVKDNRE